ncbi:hypothetical protein DFH08DRAFT_816132 [Mycena albidolilacea]|uniref:Uncharacterized protein n=1 Tax=Mycena albidolilacea TaxID=1033008 RepID=A0AAD7EJ01_9AGAR|nr:hypothetical protein DFH08DRAFT_816132 [Mycena albidolilacea]
MLTPLVRWKIVAAYAGGSTYEMREIDASAATTRVLGSVLKKERIGGQQEKESLPDDSKAMKSEKEPGEHRPIAVELMTVKRGASLVLCGSSGFGIDFDGLCRSPLELDTCARSSLHAPTSTAALLAAATLVGAASIDNPRTTIFNETACCGTTHWFNGIAQYHSLQSGTRSRDYPIHLPSLYDANKPYPLVLGFHRSSSVGFFFEADTGLSGSKDDLLDKIRAGWCVENRRIYATGPPSAAASSTPSPAPPSAATSPPSPPAWAPSFYTDHSGVSGPLPVLKIRGGSNTEVPYAGGAGEGGTEPAIPDWLSWWAARNGCTAANTTETCTEGESVLKHWKVDDMRVGFPGVRQDGATPRQKKEGARRKKDSGGREKD